MLPCSTCQITSGLSTYFFTYVFTHIGNMLVKSKVRINMNSKQFYQGSTTISCFGTQKCGLWLFSGLAFMWLLLNHAKSLLAVICNSKITVSMSEAQVYGVVSSAYFSMSKPSHSWSISIEFVLKSNGPKIEPCRTPYSILKLLLKHSFIMGLM